MSPWTCAVFTPGTAASVHLRPLAAVAAAPLPGPAAPASEPSMAMAAAAASPVFVLLMDPSLWPSGRLVPEGARITYHLVGREGKCFSLPHGARRRARFLGCAEGTRGADRGAHAGRRRAAGPDARLQRLQLRRRREGAGY